MKEWSKANTVLGAVVALLIIISMVVGAVAKFETKENHEKDVQTTKEYLTLYIKSAANEAATEAVQRAEDRWLRAKRRNGNGE